MLTHVCRAWRRIFTSYSSLWTQFERTNAEKTRVYLERSKSSPIVVHLWEMSGLSPHDPFHQIISHALGRLGSLSVGGMARRGLQELTAHLIHPAPLLRHLSIDGSHPDPQRNPVVTTALFNGDLSSLHALHLHCVRTELPWGNMMNLTSFSLEHTPPGKISIGQLLDFFEGAPHLCEVVLRFVTPASGGQDGRLVSLMCLKSLTICQAQPTSILFDHLLIPVGADLHMRLESPCPGLRTTFPDPSTT